MAKLILISGSPWVGKTAAAEELFKMLSNCAWLDGDDVWRVNPFSVEDPRLRKSDDNMAFVVQTYLRSEFDYVILSSVVLTYPDILRGIIERIEAPDYDLVHFVLVCDAKVLAERCRNRDQSVELELHHLEQSFSPKLDAIRVDTTCMDPEAVARFICDKVTR